MQGAPLTRVATPHSPDRWVFIGLLCLLAWLPVPWGSKPAAATAFFGTCIASLALLKLMMAMRGHGLPQVPGAARLVLGLWLAWFAWSALHVLPLPGPLLEWLSPSAYAVHAALSPLGIGASSTLSILPGASIDQLILSANYLCLFWLVMVLTARNRPRQRAVLMALVLSGLAQALYGSVMTLSGLEYGFLEPKTYNLGLATGTFVNRNHFAGYLELSLAAGIALVLADLRPSPTTGWRDFFAGLLDLALSRRMRIRIMLALMVIGLVLTRSRGGNAAFFVALAICGSVFILVRHPKYFGKSLIFFLSLFLVDLLIVSRQYGLEHLAERIESTHLETEQRTLVFNELEPVLREYWLAGSGPGTFAAAYSPHRSEQVRQYFDHAHNDHLEFIIEAGVPGYVLLALIAVVTLAHALAVIRRRRDPMASALAFAGATGLGCLLIHGLTDFNLRIPAVAATLLVLMALALSCSSVPSHSRRRPRMLQA